MKKRLIRDADRYDDKNLRFTFDRHTVISLLKAGAVAWLVWRVLGTIYLALVVFIVMVFLFVGRIEGVSVKERVQDELRLALVKRHKDYAHAENRILIYKKEKKDKKGE